MRKQWVAGDLYFNNIETSKETERPAMPLSDALIDEHYGEEITAIHVGRGVDSEEYVTYFRGGAKIWLSRAEIITRMMRGKKFYARKDDWRGELEVVPMESAKGYYLRTIPVTGSSNTLLSLPRE